MLDHYIWYQEPTFLGTMAEGTRNKELLEACKRTEIMLVEERAMREAGERSNQGRFDEISQAQNGLQSELVAMQQQLQNIATQMQMLNRGKSILGEPPVGVNMERGSPSHQSSSRVSIGGAELTGAFMGLNPMPKLEFPRFDGENPQSWVEKCDKYFKVLFTFPENKRVDLAYIYLEGDAKIWVREYLEERDTPTWDDFVAMILQKFGLNEVNSGQEVEQIDESCLFEKMPTRIISEAHLIDEVFVQNFATPSEIEVNHKVFAEMIVKENKSVKMFDKMVRIEFNELKEIESGNKIVAVLGSFLDNERMAFANLLNTTTYGNEKIDNNIEQIPEVYFHVQVKLRFHYVCDDIVNFIIDPGGTIVYYWNLKLFVSIDVNNSNLEYLNIMLECFRNTDFKQILLIYNSRMRYKNCGITDYWFKGDLRIDLWMRALGTSWVYVIFTECIIIFLLMLIHWNLHFNIHRYCARKVYVNDMVGNQFHVKSAIVIRLVLLTSLKEISRLTITMESFALNVLKLHFLLQINWLSATEYMVISHVIWLVSTSQAGDLRIWFELIWFELSKTAEYITKMRDYMLEQITGIPGDAFGGKKKKYFVISDGYINPSSDIFNGNGRISIEGVLDSLHGKSGFNKLRKSSNRREKKSVPTLAPISHTDQERLERKAAYEQSTKDITKWETLVKKNTEPSTLSSTLYFDEDVNLGFSTRGAITSEIQPRTDFEGKMASLVNQNEVVEAHKNEGARLFELNKIFVEDMIDRQERLAMDDTDDMSASSDQDIASKLLAKIKEKTLKVLETEEKLPTSGAFSLPSMVHGLNKRKEEGDEEAKLALDEYESSLKQLRDKMCNLICRILYVTACVIWKLHIQGVMDQLEFYFTFKYFFAWNLCAKMFIHVGNCTCSIPIGAENEDFTHVKIESPKCDPCGQGSENRGVMS